MILLLQMTTTLTVMMRRVIGRPACPCQASVRQRPCRVQGLPSFDDRVPASVDCRASTDHRRRSLESRCWFSDHCLSSRSSEWLSVVVESSHHQHLAGRGPAMMIFAAEGSWKSCGDMSCQSGEARLCAAAWACVNLLALSRACRGHSFTRACVTSHCVPDTVIYLYLKVLCALRTVTAQWHHLQWSEVGVAWADVTWHCDADVT